MTRLIQGALSLPERWSQLGRMSFKEDAIQKS